MYYELAKDILILVLMSSISLVIIIGTICTCVCMVKALIETLQGKK